MSQQDGDEKIEVVPRIRLDVAPRTNIESERPDHQSASENQVGDATQDAQHDQTGENRSKVTAEQWLAIRSILEYLLGYREEDGHDPSKVFHKRVNKRNVPTYYEVIKEPMAFSNLKASLTNQEYNSFTEFVRECALIWHNAHTYNRPDAGAYQDALTMKRLMEQELQKLADRGVVSAEEIQWPDLGEIPPVEDLPEEEEEDDEDEDEEEDEEESDDDGQKKKRKARRSSAVAPRGTTDAPKRRGRPPKVDTPMEGRIKSILKGLRKVKDDAGTPRILQFEKLPDKAAMPEYYQEIKRPVSIEQLKKSLKRKRYASVDHFMGEVDTMFDNAKAFNEDDSQIFEDADFLQREAHKLAEVAKNRPDSEFVMDEGRKPRPGGIDYLGEMWRVGDWVHIRNANDISKPIIAQIYRTWEDADGQQWLNACWYYRPEQTVHHFEKHFWPNEVLKTGQYRDHRVEELIDRCFIMFYTRYAKGRPRGIAPDREVYVCEARYNEEKHRINKIKTWASCLPDEVRDKDYEMELFENHTTRRVKKIPSPLANTLSEETKDASNPPQPRWGIDNAPPIVGGVYKGPREDNQSPPPEPTPEPVPQPPPPPRQNTRTPSQETMNHGDRGVSNVATSRAPLATTNIQSSLSPPQMQPSSQSFVSIARQIQHSQSQTPSTLATGNAALQISAYNQHGSSKIPLQNTAHYAAIAATPSNSQRAPDVYYLQAANAAIPADIRNEFQQDRQGHVLFFPKPPISVQRPDSDVSRAQLPIRLRAALIRSRRSRKELESARTSSNVPERPTKRRRESKEEKEEQAVDVEAMLRQCREWLKGQQNGTDEIWKVNYGDGWQKVRDLNAIRLEAIRSEARAHRRVIEAKLPSNEQLIRETYSMLAPQKVYKDEVNPRF